MKRYIRILKKDPDRLDTHTLLIPNTLDMLQKLVDGYIEVVPYPYMENVAIICNEEGLINDMKYNCRLDDYHFFGPIIFVGVDGEDFTDVPAGLEATWKSGIQSGFKMEENNMITVRRGEETTVINLDGTIATLILETISVVEAHRNELVNRADNPEEVIFHFVNDLINAAWGKE